MSSIEDLPDYLRAIYRNPETQVPIWKAAALVMDIPPEDFKEPEPLKDKGFSYQPCKRLSEEEKHQIERFHCSVMNALVNMAKSIGYQDETRFSAHCDETTQVPLFEVMRWCAMQDGLRPKIWEGIDLRNPAQGPDSEDKREEQAAQLTIEQLYPFLDKSHPRYSEELAAAVSAWLAFEQVEVDSATKKALEWWLEANKEALGIIGGGAIERIATVANWNKKGGTARTGSGVKLKEAPELEAVTEQLNGRLSQLNHRIQRQQGNTGKFAPSPYITTSKLEQLLEQAIESVVIRLMENKSRLRPEVQERIAQLAEDLKKARDAHMASKSDESDFSDVPF